MAIDIAQRVVSILPGGNGTRGGDVRSEAAVREPAMPEPQEVEVKPKKIDPKELELKLESINRELRDRQRNLSFFVDSSTGKTIVQVLRESTGEIVRQIPSEEALAIAHAIERGEPVTSVGLDEVS